MKTIYYPDCKLPLHLCGSHVGEKCAGEKDEPEEIIPVDLDEPKPFPPPEKHGKNCCCIYC